MVAAFRISNSSSLYQSDVSDVNSTTGHNIICVLVLCDVDLHISLSLVIMYGSIGCAGGIQSCWQILLTCDISDKLQT